MRLYGVACAAQEIVDSAGCSRSSLKGWCRAHREGGVEALVDTRVVGSRAKLTPAGIRGLSRTVGIWAPREQTLLLRSWLLNSPDNLHARFVTAL